MTRRRRRYDEACQNLHGRLKSIRSHLGLTQQEMSDRLATVGVRCARGTIAKLEVGLHHVTLPIALGYADVAGLTVEQLVSPQPVRLQVAI